MKLLPALLCAALIAFVLPACTTTKTTKTSCCSDGKCEKPMKKH
jgi:hypothetical protein